MTRKLKLHQYTDFELVDIAIIGAALFSCTRGKTTIALDAVVRGSYG
jgi:hypothetical protein